MLEKLRSAEQKYISIEETLADPSVFSDQEKYTSLMKEYKALTPIIEKYREYQRADTEISELKEMLDGSLEPDMRDMVSDEYKLAQKKVDRSFGRTEDTVAPQRPERR